MIGRDQEVGPRTGILVTGSGGGKLVQNSDVFGLALETGKKNATFPKMAKSMVAFGVETAFWVVLPDGPNRAWAGAMRDPFIGPTSRAKAGFLLSRP